MSGAVAAHAAYNGSGTQGLAVTNKIHDDDGDVMSVFWNKNDTTRQLLYGSTLVEVPSSGASNVNLGGSRLFTVNNDIDCLGDMYLEIKGKLATYVTTGTNTTGDLEHYSEPFALAPLISRIEFQVGTQIWQTIEQEDLLAVNFTELTDDLFKQTSLKYTLTTKSDGTIDRPQQSIWLVIPSLTKTLGPKFNKFTNQTEDGYPMAAAPHQSVKIKVYFSHLTAPEELIASKDADPGPDRTLHVKGNSVGRFFHNAGHDIGKAAHAVAHEASKLGKGIGHFFRKCKLTAEVPIKAGDVIGNKNSEYSISSCKLYVKQQIMCNEEREQIKTMPMGLPKRLKMTQNASTHGIASKTKTIELDHFSLFASHLIICGSVGESIRLESAELKLNSSSYSGQLPGVLLDSCTADSLGLYSNKLEEIEPHVDQEGNKGYDISYDPSGIGVYVFPLASTAFSGSCIPLNRFDSIRLTLTFTEIPPEHSAKTAFINVTCVGETTALFKDGAASLAMY